jgi:hypothetical protein
VSWDLSGNPLLSPVYSNLQAYKCLGRWQQNTTASVTTKHSSYFSDLIALAKWSLRQLSAFSFQVGTTLICIVLC